MYRVITLLFNGLSWDIAGTKARAANTTQNQKKKMAVQEDIGIAAAIIYD